MGTLIFKLVYGTQQSKEGSNVILTINDDFNLGGSDGDGSHCVADSKGQTRKDKNSEPLPRDGEVESPPKVDKEKKRENMESKTNWKKKRTKKIKVSSNASNSKNSNDVKFLKLVPGRRKQR